jgi:hypothetical protein
MLSLFDSFVVPGVEYVTMYKDDQDPNLYYMLPEYPRMTLAGDGGPQFNLVIFARDFRLFKDAAADLSRTETEGGLITMTTELSVSEEDQAKIRDYIAGGGGPLGIRSLFFGPSVFRYEMLVRPLSNAIRLAYPVWVDGKVQFTLIPAAGDTFVKATAGSDKPSLMGSNLANYQALLGQEGVGLFNAMVGKGWTPGMVSYSVTFLARIPSLTVSVTGSMTDTFQNIRDNFCTPYNYYGRLYYRLILPFNDLQQIRNKVASLTIDVSGTDFPSDNPDKSIASDVEQKLTDLAMDVIKNFLTNQFFTTFNQLGAQGSSGSSDSSDSSGGPPPTDGLFLQNFSQTQTNTIDFHINYNENVPVTKNPSRALLDIIPADQVTKRIIQADLSHPYFQILDVTVRVTADFETDPIAAIKVHIEYNQTDETGGGQKAQTQEFGFLTGQEVFRFQQVMAKAADGTPKDTYTYWSEIQYKASEKDDKTTPQTVNDRILVIGYNQLNCIRVQASWGAIPADTISRVSVHFNYPDPTLNLATQQKDVSLTPTNVTDSWFTYTGGNPSIEYEYQVSYFLTAGQRMDMPVQKSKSSTLIVDSPFEDMLTVTFVPQGQFPPINTVMVSARYTDPGDGYTESAVHQFTALTDTWTWTVRLHDKTKRAFQYKTDITYVDGSSDAGTWLDGAEGTILVGAMGGRKIMEVDVIPAMLDLQKQWKLVIVKLKYEDPANNVSVDKVFQISAANAGDQFAWKFPIMDPKQQKYSYEVDAYGFDGVANKVVGPLQTDNQALVLQL